LRALTSVPLGVYVYGNTLLRQCLVDQLAAQLTTPPQEPFFFSNNDTVGVCP